MLMKSGTICQVDPLPGVPDFFCKMEKLGKKYHFITNNSHLTDEEYSTKLKKCGFDHTHGKVLYPSHCVGQYLKEIHFDKTLYCIAGEETIKVLKSYGITCATGPFDPPSRYADHVKYFKDDLSIGGVFLDGDMRVNMAMGYKATTYLSRPEVLFICGAMDKLMPIRIGGKPVFTPTIMTYAIIEDCGRQPLVIGKPSKAFSDIVNKRLEITDPSRVLFIGDSIQSDVGMGKNAGYKTFLLLTSHTYEDMMKESKCLPDFYCKNLGELTPKLSALLSK